MPGPDDPPRRLLLALDDTDDREGGCTTHLAFHLLLALPELALEGMPRLVRLNPNVPFKTRGNGAVVLPLVVPNGPATRVGELRGQEIRAFPEGAARAPAPMPLSPREVLERVAPVVGRLARPGAHPGVAVFAEPPPPAYYWLAVRTRLDAHEAAQALRALDVPFQVRREGRAAAGLLGAAAWPGPPSSFEFLAYREPSRWGTPRDVSPGPLLPLDAGGATFHTVDPGSGRLLCVPHGPDPVLMGLRGRDPERLMAAVGRAVPAAAREPVDGWLLWATNQASGDHVTPVEHLARAPPWATVSLPATVAAAPVHHPGGHHSAPCVDAAGAEVTAMAFEPTQGLRRVVAGLRPGDAVTLVGALHSETGAPAVHLEKLEVRSQAPQRRKVANPACACGKSMKSRGAGGGYRCLACGKRSGAEGTWEDEARDELTGWHEVPPGARRHLHRPQ